MDIEEVLEGIVETLAREYDPDKIILFGSHARGEAGPDSDLDLLVIKDTDKDIVERIVAVSRSLRWVRKAPYHFPMDILVRTPVELQERLEMGDDFLLEVMEQGRVLYERRAA